MNKHKFNILPDMQPDEFRELVESIRIHGYDNDQRIVIYQDAILDGWHRYTAALEVGMNPTAIPLRQFIGDDIKAFQFVVRANMRRNLTSQQRSILAAKATDLITMLTEANETRRREKISQFRQGQIESQAVANNASHYERDEFSQDLIEDIPDVGQTRGNNSPRLSEDFGYTYEMLPEEMIQDDALVVEHLAKAFGSNPKYVKKARKLKRENPALAAQVKAGETTFQQIEKEAQAVAEPEPDDPTRDEFTAYCVSFSKKLTVKYNEIAELVGSAETFFDAHEQPLIVWCRRIRSSADFREELAELNKISGLRLCYQCEGRGDDCGTCRRTGYVTGSQYLEFESQNR